MSRPHDRPTGKSCARDLPNRAFRIDDEQAAQIDAVIIPIHAVLAADLRIGIPEQRDGHRSQPALLSGQLSPCQVREVGIGGTGDDLCIHQREFGCPVTEGDDFRGTDEREVPGIEEEDDPLATILGQRDLFELAVLHDRRPREVRCLLSDLRERAQPTTCAVGQDGAVAILLLLL